QAAPAARHPPRARPARTDVGRSRGDPRPSGGDDRLPRDLPGPPRRGDRRGAALARTGWGAAPDDRVASSAVHLLAIDVGNTQTVIGLYALHRDAGATAAGPDGGRLADTDLLDHWRIATNVERTAD